MPYDELLPQRVRRALQTRDGIMERKMFGGLAFMLHGNMTVGVEQDRLMVRVGTDGGRSRRRRPGTIHFVH